MGGVYPDRGPAVREMDAVPPRVYPPPVVGASEARLLRVGLALCAAAAAVQAGAADLAEVKARGRLRVLAMAPRPDDVFFSSQETTERPGFDREMLEGFARLHRVTVETVRVTGWDQLVPDLLAGKGDVVAGRFTATEERRRRVAFTVEVFPTRCVVVTRRPVAPVLTVERLRTLRVGTVRGTSLADAVARAGVPTANVDDTVASGHLAQALVDGTVQAVALGVEDAISEQRTDPSLELGMFLGPPSSLAYAVARTDTALLAALDAYIDNVKKTATYSRLVVKYFGEKAPEALKKARSE
jgi:ABC-type amino acid transport substrate-binding protein